MYAHTYVQIMSTEAQTNIQTLMSLSNIRKFGHMLTEHPTP